MRQLEGWMGTCTWEPTRYVTHKYLTVGLLSGELLDVESPSLSVDSLDLALSALESTSHDFHDIALAHGD